MTDLGLFGPDSVSWRVHGEPVLALAGLRALYLQALHPRAMAGLAQTSGYRSDLWGRLERTAIYITTVVYGPSDDARAAAARVRRVHSRLRGTDPATGEQFRVDEPDLLRWIHVTVVESFLTTARRAGVRLTDDEADQYLAEQRTAAELIGLDPATVPGSVADVAAYYDSVRPDLKMTRQAAEALLFLSTTVPMRWGLGYTPVRGAWLALSALAVSLLPPWARELYGLPVLSATDLSATLSARALRLTLRALPRRLLEGPIYRSALRRAAEAAAAGAGYAGTSTAVHG
jgi:uncharacterized protein (DUF2236 family)